MVAHQTRRSPSCQEQREGGASSGARWRGAGSRWGAGKESWTTQPFGVTVTPLSWQTAGSSRLREGLPRGQVEAEGSTESCGLWSRKPRDRPHSSVPLSWPRSLLSTRPDCPPPLPTFTLDVSESSHPPHSIPSHLWVQQQRALPSPSHHGPSPPAALASRSPCRHSINKQTSRNVQESLQAGGIRACRRDAGRRVLAGNPWGTAVFSQIHVRMNYPGTMLKHVIWQHEPGQSLDSVSLTSSWLVTTFPQWAQTHGVTSSFTSVLFLFALEETLSPVQIMTWAYLPGGVLTVHSLSWLPHAICLGLEKDAHLCWPGGWVLWLEGESSRTFQRGAYSCVSEHFFLRTAKCSTAA